MQTVSATGGPLDTQQSWIEWIDALMRQSGEAIYPATHPAMSRAASMPEVIAAHPIHKRRVTVGLRQGGALAAAAVVLVGVVEVGANERSTILRSDVEAAAQVMQQGHTVQFRTVLSLGGKTVELAGTADLESNVVRVEDESFSRSGARLVSSVAFYDVANKTMFIPSSAAESSWSGIDAELSALAFDPLDAVRAVEVTGNEIERGAELISDRIEARHFEVPISLAAALRAAGTSLDEVSAHVDGGLPRTVAYHVWVDDAGAIRQIEFEIPGMSTVVHFLAQYSAVGFGPAVELPEVGR